MHVSIMWIKSSMPCIVASRSDQRYQTPGLGYLQHGILSQGVFGKLVDLGTEQNLT